MRGPYASGLLYIDNDTAVMWSCGQVVMWSSGQVVKWSSGHVVKWSCGQVVVIL